MDKTYRRTLSKADTFWYAYIQEKFSHQQSCRRAARYSMNVLARYVRIKGNIRTLLEYNLAYAAISFYCTFLPSCKT